MYNKQSNPVAGFIWQHILLLISLYILTLGVVLCVRSNLGSSVISSTPLAFTIAGAEGLVPSLSLGMYTNILNALLIVGQIVVLRSKFQPVQLLQLVVGALFGVLIDINMLLTASWPIDTLPAQLLAQFLGCSVMALGVAMEVRCGSITMPGEGLPIAISRVTSKPFASVKIWVDVCLVVSAIISCYVFFDRWMWNVTGWGTLFAMVYVGALVKLIHAHMGWFDKCLYSVPGFRRLLLGLARFRNSRAARSQK